MYLSHYMYHGLVITFTYIVLLLSIYMMYVSSPYLTCVVSFLSLYTCFFFYTTCLCFKLDALMNLV